MDVHALVDEALPLLEFWSSRIARALDGAVPADDLKSVAHEALFDAARAFDPARAAWRTYASRRVKWAMLDLARKETHGRAAARALAIAERERMLDAREPEAAPEPREEAYEQRLDALLARHAAAHAAGLALAPAAASSPEDEVADAQARALVWRAVAELPERQRALVERHYRDGEAFDAVAQSLGISKSWASRLHAQAIEALGARLRDES